MPTNKLVLVFVLSMVSCSIWASDDDSFIPTFGDLSALQAQKMYWDLKNARDEKKLESAKYGQEGFSGSESLGGRKN